MKEGQSKKFDVRQRSFLLAIVLAVFLGVFFIAGCSGEPKREIKNFAKVATEVKKTLSDKTKYPFITGVRLEVNEDKKTIYLFGVTEPATVFTPSMAMFCADLLRDLTNDYVAAYGNFEVGGKAVDLKPRAKDYYGGLWDYYDCNLYVIPYLPDVDPATVKERAFIDTTIQKGMHAKQAPRLSKKYEDAYIAEMAAYDTMKKAQAQLQASMKIAEDAIAKSNEAMQKLQ